MKLPINVVYVLNKLSTILLIDDKDFANQVLDAHNRFRQIHQSSSLSLDPDLTVKSQQYAEILAKRGLLEHARNISDGESLAMKCLGPQEKDPTGAFFTTLW